jgi:hypothetical protein
LRKILGDNLANLRFLVIALAKERVEVFMWSAGFGMLLILGGLAAALFPILYGFHREILHGRTRRLLSGIAPMSSSSELKCAHCGEVVDDTYFVFMPRIPEYESAELYEAS